MIYRVVWRFDPQQEWMPVPKLKSTRPRYYDHRAFARCALTLMSMASYAAVPYVEYAVQGIETNGEWHNV